MESSLPQGLRAAIALLPKDPNTLPPFWRSAMERILIAISDALGSEANVATILHYATLPSPGFHAWAKSLPESNPGRIFFLDDWPNLGISNAAKEDQITTFVDLVKRLESAIITAHPAEA